MFNINPEDKILVITPHPESIILGCGGFISKYSNQIDLLCVVPYDLPQFHTEDFRGVFSVVSQNFDFSMVYIGKNPEDADETF